MPEHITDDDWFRHFHQAALTELIVIIKEESERPTDGAQKRLLDEHQATLNNILARLGEEKPDPASIFQKGLRALADVDKERFLLENLLEAVKRGESFRNTLERYHAVGLTDIDVSQLPLETPPSEKEKAPALPASSVGAGNLLQQFLNKLKQVATKTMQIVINAMKVIPKFIGIKPSIGFSGPFPSFSLQFELQTESITLHELFQDLTRGLGGWPRAQ